MNLSRGFSRPADLSGLFRNRPAFPLGEFRGARFSALRCSERGERLRMYVLALCGLQYVTDGLLHDAKCVLYRIGALTASACSGRHARSMTCIMPKSKSPVIRLIPSSGKRLKEVSSTVDLLLMIMSALLPILLQEHAHFRLKLIGDLKRLRDSAVWSADDNAALNKAIRVFERMTDL